MSRLTRLLLLVILAACAQAPTGAPRSGQPSPYPSPSGQRYQASATVLQSPAHGPELCVGGMALSLPPQCGGPAISNWDWDAVDDEERASGTIWGDYIVVGTFDGTTFTLTQPPEKLKTNTQPSVIKTACDPPAGGWPHPETATDQDIEAVVAMVSKDKDYAGLWISYEGTPRPEYLDPRRAGSNDPATAVLNIAFRGDASSHEAGIRRLWEGGLCLIDRRLSLAELERIRTRAEEFVQVRSLQMLTSDANEVTYRVEISVVFSDADDQKAFDAKFGKGVVVLVSAIKPVE